MASTSGRFPHLPLPVLVQGTARPPKGGGKEHEQTIKNKTKRNQHAAKLNSEIATVLADWNLQKSRRSDGPPLPIGLPLLLKVEPSPDLDYLITTFGFEILSEEEDGYVLVASSDEQLATFLQRIQDFTVDVRGSGNTAKVYQVETGVNRLKHILSDELFEAWPHLADDERYVLDVSIECLGTERYPERPKRGLAETTEEFELRVQTYKLKHPDRDVKKYRKSRPQAREESYDSFLLRERDWQAKVLQRELYWEDLKDERFEAFERILIEGHGRVLRQREGPGRLDSIRLPDTVEVRVEISGSLLRDLTLNYPFIFKISEPPEAEGIQHGLPLGTSQGEQYVVLPPDPGDPIVGVIDSGIQEGHRLIAPAISPSTSVSYVPDFETQFGDFVAPSGHGTRVAGAVLYGETIPSSGKVKLPCWIRNIRVLDENCALSNHLAPPFYLKALGPTNQERIYNHSINSRRPCRRVHMSHWATTMDLLSYDEDILFIQSVGNLPGDSSQEQFPGILGHLRAGRAYPRYLLESSSRIATPAESLQALTVGSIAYPTTHPHRFGDGGHPSSFSRAGLGIWDSIKPDVVEYGGDWVHDGNERPRLVASANSCPDLVRSTLHEPGPAHSRDVPGTSFAAPKVARLAAILQKLFPSESTLLYRALIAQSARWPEHAWNNVESFRHFGYGLPDEARATTNSPYRVTLISSGEQRLVGRDAHIYEVPVPKDMCRPEMSNLVRLEVTLSYAAKPRRTRRTHARYLSTWLSWDVSKKNESKESFQSRVLKDVEEVETDGDQILPWVVRERSDWGIVDGVSRNRSTLQKDWCVVPVFQLPKSFCVAVVGHAGWAENEANAAKYALAISFEMVNKDLEIYEMVRTEIDKIQAPVQVRVRVEG